MIDLHSEQLLTMTQAARSLPGRVALSTLHRWRLRGIRGVRLETLMVGGRRMVSREALARFTQAVTQVGEPPRSDVISSGNATSYRQAASELDKAGI